MLVSVLVIVSLLICSTLIQLLLCNNSLLDRELLNSAGELMNAYQEISL